MHGRFATTVDESFGEEVDGVLRYRQAVSGYRQAASLRTRAGHGAFCGETYVA